MLDELSTVVTVQPTIGYGSRSVTSSIAATTRE
jgi:hypothetical protein